MIIITINIYYRILLLSLLLLFTAFLVAVTVCACQPVAGSEGLQGSFGGCDDGVHKINPGLVTHGGGEIAQIGIKILHFVRVRIAATRLCNGTTRRYYNNRNVMSTRLTY